MVKKTIITILMMVILSSIALASTYTLSGNTALINDTKAYISATPHTMSGSGWVQVELQAKTYTGNIDFAIGTDSANAQLTSFEIYKLVNASNGTYAYVPYTLSQTSYNYDGKNTWNYATNVPVTAGQTYTARFYLNIVQGTSGKYDIAVKPSSQSFSTAIAGGNFYLLDPWWNYTNTSTEWNYGAYTSYWSEIMNTTSNARIQPIPLRPDIIEAQYELEGNYQDEYGKYAGTVGSAPTPIVTCVVGGCMNYTHGPFTYLPVPNFFKTSTNVSFMLWINVNKFDATTHTNTIFAYDASSAGYPRWGLELLNSTHIQFWSNNLATSAGTSATNGTINTGQWYHVALIQNGTNVKIYLNGIKIKDATATYGTAFGNRGEFLLGKHRSDGGGSETNEQPYNGSVDSFEIFNGVLTEQDILNDYNNGTGKRYNEVRLQANYPFNQNLQMYYRMENNTLEENLKYAGINTNVTFPNSQKLGQSAFFDATTSFINVTNPPTTTANMSWDFWINPNMTIDKQEIFSKWGVNKYSYAFEIVSGNLTIDLSSNCLAGTITGITTSLPFTNKTLQHIGITVNGTTLKVYKNGTLTDTKTLGNALVECATPMIIGKNPDGIGPSYGYVMNGYMDDIRVYNKTLTDTDISYLYNSGNGRIYNDTANTFISKQLYPNNISNNITRDMFIYYDMNEASGNLINKISGKPNATQTGTIPRTTKGKLSNASGPFSGSNWYEIATTQVDTDIPFSANVWVKMVTPINTSTTYAAFYIGGNYGTTNDPILMLHYVPSAASWYFRADKWGDPGYEAKVVYNMSQHLNEWTMITVQMNGLSNRSVMINADPSLRAYDTNTATSSVASQKAEIGYNRGNSGEEFSNGYIDEIAMWNRTLTDKEISDLYNQGQALGYNFTNPLPNYTYMVGNATNNGAFQYAFTTDPTNTWTGWNANTTLGTQIALSAQGNNPAFKLNITSTATTTSYLNMFTAGTTVWANVATILLSIISPTTNQIFKNYANIYHNYTVNSTGTNSTVYCNETYNGSTTQSFQTLTTNNTYSAKSRTITDTLSQEINRNFLVYCYNEQTNATSNVSYRYDDLAPRMLINYENMNTTANNITLQHNFSDWNLTRTYIQLEDKYNYTNNTVNTNLSDSRYSNTTIWGIGTYTVTGNATDEAGNIMTFSKTFNILPVSPIVSLVFKDGITGSNVPYTSITDNYLMVTQYSNPYTSLIGNYINKTNYIRQINVSYLDLNSENLPSTQYYNITRQSSVFNYTGTPVRLILRFYDNGSLTAVNGIYSESNVSIRNTIFNFTNTLTLIKATITDGRVLIRFGLNYTNTSPSDWVQTYEFINDGMTDITEDIEVLQNVGNLTKTSWFGKTYTINPTTLESLHVQILDAGTGNPIPNAIIRSRQEERDNSNTTSKLTNQKLSNEQGNVFIIHEPETNIKLEILANGYISKVITIDPDQEIYDSSSPLIVKLVKSGEGVYRNGIVLRPKYITNETALIKLMVYAPLNSKIQYVTHKELLTNPTMLHSETLDDDKTAEIYIYNTNNCGNLAQFFGLDITEAMCLAKTDEFDNENTTIDIYMDGTYWGDITIPIYIPGGEIQETFKQEFDDLNTDYLGIIGFIALIGIAITLQTRFKGRGIGVPVFMGGIIILAFISNIFMIPAAIIVIGYIGRWIYKTIGGGQ